MIVTPILRYPGAKRKVIKKLVPFWNIEHQEYREPFAGSASIFFRKPLTKKNWLNDLDEDVSSVLLAIKNFPEELCDLINMTTPTVDLWLKMKNAQPNTIIGKAYRTIVRNRTSFSGILGANPIGGIQQNSQYTIDCRWNPERFCKNIKLCSEKLANVKITSSDFSKVIKAKGNNVLLIIDPPYYQRGFNLYQKQFDIDDHIRLMEMLKKTNHKFLLTYDDCPEIKDLYQWANIIEESWFYSISNKIQRTKGKELFILNYDIGNLQESKLKA